MIIQQPPLDGYHYSFQNIIPEAKFLLLILSFIWLVISIHVIQYYSFRPIFFFLCVG